MIGFSFSHYEIVRELGRGGTAVVYLARDKRLERDVAVKFLSGSLSLDEKGARILLHEARAAAAIDHPFVCKVYEADQIGDAFFVVMEYVQGQTLDRWARSGAAAPAQLIAIFREVLEALSKCHRLGIIHRDLKPANIMVAEGGHAKVMDFGIAKKREVEKADQTLSQPGTLIGTPAYMSPEQVFATPLDGRSDLFSLGLIAYELLAGEHPFGRRTPLETAMAIVNDPCPPIREALPDCPEDLAQWIERLLQKQPSHRFESADEALTFLRDGPVQTLETPISRAVASPNSLAVLPFVNLSSDAENEYFSDGMTEEIITQLSKSPGLKVISRTSVMAYKGMDKSLRKIGNELGVSVVLEGSIRRSSSRVRISCNLVKVDTDSSIWSETFDRELDDVFIIQAEVSKNIAQKLHQDLTATDLQAFQRTRQNLQGYQHYLKGRFFLNKLTEEGLHSAIRCFDRALECDPIDARSIAGKAIGYAYLGHFSYRPLIEVFPKARAAAHEALHLNPLLVDALNAMGLVSLFYDWDWAASEDAFKRALTVNPNSSETRIHYSWLLAALVRFQEALEEGRRAVDLDPLSMVAAVNYSWLLYYAGQCEESIVEAKRALELELGNPVALSVLAAAYLDMGAVDKSVEILQSLEGFESQLGWVYALTGKHEQAHEILLELEAAEVEKNAPLEIGVLYWLLGDAAAGLRCLEEAVRQHDSKLLYLGHLSTTRKLMEDPVFRRLIGRLGLGDVTMTEGHAKPTGSSGDDRRSQPGSS